MFGSILSRIERILFGDRSATKSDLNQLLSTVEKCGLDARGLERDIRNLIEERLLFWLIGDSRRQLNMVERKRFLTRRLRSILPSETFAKLEVEGDTLERLAEFQAAVSSVTSSQRVGVSSIEERHLVSLFRVQNYRCAVCGVPLHGSVVRETPLFESQREPVVQIHLDHVVPYYLSGNYSPYELLCLNCNTLKRERIGVHEDGHVLSGNHFMRRNEGVVARRMAFWTIYANRKCHHVGCGVGSASSSLFVQPKQGKLFTYGNLEVRCLDHADDAARWLHSDRQWQATH
jgi:hypothetical protein